MPTAFKKASSGMAACDFWRQHGNSISPHLRNVAQSVLGVPASAAVLERDLCVAGQVVSRPRGSVGVGDMEMILFLRAAHDNIPKEILALSEEQRQQAIPLRFEDADELNDVKDLDAGPENQVSSGSSGAESKAVTEAEKELQAWLEMACPVPTDDVGYDSDGEREGKYDPVADDQGKGSGTGENESREGGRPEGLGEEGDGQQRVCAMCLEEKRNE